MRVLAVDFGTSNTVAALGVDGGTPRLITIDGSPLVPSSVFLADDGTLAVGRDADRQARIDPSRYEPNPKRRIDDGFILLGASALPVTAVIAEVLRRVAGEVRRQLGGEPDQVRLTHPARWGRRRREALLTAAAESGLGREPVLIPEPVAAATHFATLTLAGGVRAAGVPGTATPQGVPYGSGLRDGRALAVYDLGGGTFDIAVLARRGGGYEVLAEAGLPDLGGLDFDHAITEHIGSTHAGTIDPAAWQRLLDPTDAASRRQARVLATDVREGKEALSRHPHIDIALPPPFPDVHLTRAEFEDLIRPNLQRSVQLMARTIADAGLAPGQLAGVYLVGGSSRIPLVARLIQQGMGLMPTTLDQPETSVVTGALYLPLGAQTVGQPATGHPVGPAPSGVPGGLPPLHVRGAAPQAQVRPLGGPGGVPVPPPGWQRGAAPRPLRRRPGGLKAVAVAVAVPVVVALGTTAFLYGTGDDGPAPGPAGSGTPPSGSAFAEFFTDDTVRGYVAPTFGEIQSCQRGFASNSSAAAPSVPGATTCTYRNGIIVAFAKAGTQSQVEVFRDAIAQFLPAAVHLTPKKGDWSGGHIDEYTGTSDNALYWDDRETTVYAFGSVDAGRMTIARFRQWWRQRFGS